MNHAANYIFTKHPKGVVLNLKSANGYVVFNNPTLLPNEKFLPIELLRPKHKKKR